MPQHGDKVRIKPAVEHRVLYAPGRFLDLKKEEADVEMVWTPFLDERLRTGEIEIVHSEKHLEALRKERAEAAQAEKPAEAEAPALPAEAEAPALPAAAPPVDLDVAVPPPKAKE